MQQNLVIQCFLNDFFKKDTYQIVKLTGDGSNRKIFRVFYEKDSFILVFNENIEENHRFLSLSKALQKRDISVPQIYTSNKGKSLYLQEDLGKQNFAEILSSNKFSDTQILKKYLKIIENLENLHQQKQVLKECNICFQSLQIFSDHINYFQKYFLNYFDKSREYITSIQSELLLLVEILESYCQSTKNGIITRDFQARNIFIYQNKIYIIDYQDICGGNIFYDLASLIFASSSGLTAVTRRQLLSKLVQNYFSQDFFFLFFCFVLIRRLRSLGTYTNLGVIGSKKKFQNYFYKTFQELLAIQQEYNVYQKFPKIMEMITDFSKKETFFEQNYVSGNRYR